jgi:hypothetical protein
MVADFNIRSIRRAPGQRHIKREFHIAGALRLFARGKDLFRQIRGRYQTLGQGHVVIGQEHDLEIGACDWVGIPSIN